MTKQKALALIGILCLWLSIGSNIKAFAGVEVELREKTNEADLVSLEFRAFMPAQISSFSIRFNYNEEAFSFLAGLDPQLPGFSVTYELASSEPGIVLITGQSNGQYLEQAEYSLATIELEPKASGQARVLLEDSFFYTPSGDTIPGTMFYYLTLDVTSKQLSTASETTESELSSPTRTSSLSSKPTEESSRTTQATSPSSQTTVTTSTSDLSEGSNESKTKYPSPRALSLTIIIALVTIVLILGGAYVIWRRKNN